MDAKATEREQFLFDAGELYPVGRRCVPGVSGRGPAGETCGTCRHLVRTGNNLKQRAYLKCGLLQHRWTHGPATDIRASWLACEYWEANEETPADVAPAETFRSDAKQ